MDRFRMMTLVIGFVFILWRFTHGFHYDNGHYGDEYRLLLLGKTGHGKSSLGNHLLGREAFKSSPSPNSVTRSGQMERGKIGDTPITVVDTPGFSDTLLDQSQTVSFIAEALDLYNSFNGILLVLNPNVRITPEEKHVIKLIHELFGDIFFKFVIFVFTHKNGFEDRTSGSDYSFQKYLGELDDEMKTFFSKAWGRYVFMDTKERNNHQRKLTNMLFLEHLENIRKSTRGYNIFLEIPEL